ncbi:MAG: hypothetical protein U0V70_18880 [Terriglobia bacterium]
MSGARTGAVATLERGKAARNPKGTGNGFTVGKWGRHRPLFLLSAVLKCCAAAGYLSAVAVFGKWGQLNSWVK